MKRAILFLSLLATAGGLCLAFYGLFVAFEIPQAVAGIAIAVVFGVVSIAASPPRARRKVLTVVGIIAVVALVYYVIFGTQAGRRYLDLRAGIVPEDRPLDDTAAAATTVYTTRRQGTVVRRRSEERIAEAARSKRARSSRPQPTPRIAITALSVPRFATHPIATRSRSSKPEHGA